MTVWWLVGGSNMVSEQWYIWWLSALRTRFFFLFDMAEIG